MNTKAIVLAVIGLMLIGTNLAVVSPMVMSNTEAALEEATVWTEEKWEDEDWQSSTIQRAFFAWNLANPSEAKSDSNGDTVDDLGNAIFERMGPFIYNVTTNSEVLSHAEDSGTVTYTEYNEYEWCEGCTWTDGNGTVHTSLPGTTPVTNINILYDTQRIGALGSIIEQGPNILKGTFTKNMLEIDLSERAPGRWTANELVSDLAEYAANESLVPNGTAEQEALGAKAWVLTQAGASAPTLFNETIINHIFLNASDPSTGVCIAFTCELGPMLIHRMGEPDSTNSVARATAYGYTVNEVNGNINVSATIEADQIVYDAINTRYVAQGGAADLTTLSDADLKARLVEVSGVSTTFAESKMQNLLFGMDGGNPIGLLVCDADGFICGTTNLGLLGSAFDLPKIIEQYGLGLQSLEAVAINWMGGWYTDGRNYEMILSDGTGYLNADDWVYAAFGAKNPVTGECVTLGLNGPLLLNPNRCMWEITYSDSAVDLTIEQSQNILEHEHYGLTKGFATDFLYGEINGKSVPMNESMLPEAGGTQHVWDNQFVADLYDIDTNAAAALRWFLYDTLFTDNVGRILESGLLTDPIQPILTMEVNNWLLGWEDPLVGWASLEKNATYYGSGGIPTDGAVSKYTVYTGAKDGHPGQRIFEWDMGGTTWIDADYAPDLNPSYHNICLQEGESSGAIETDCNSDDAPHQNLAWRTTARSDATYGLLGEVSQANVVGTVFPADTTANMNLGGYAIVDSTVIGKDSIAGIKTYQHNIVVDPLANPIQAKLLAQESILDVFPNALPVYFGGAVEMQVEPSVNAVLGLQMDSYFYLDTRGIYRGVGQDNPTLDDLQPVFQISIEKSIEGSQEWDEDKSDDFKNQVIHNQRPYAYWTNFDTGADAMYIDQITFAIWLIADLMLLAALVMVFRGDRESEGDKFFLPPIEDDLLEESTDGEE